MHVLVVNFNLENMSHAEYAKACDEQFAPAFAGMQGLLFKLWLSDPESNTYGGVYAWRDRQAMEDFLSSDLFNLLVSSPNFVNITSKDFDILEEPTRVTGGLLAAVR